MANTNEDDGECTHQLKTRRKRGGESMANTDEGQQKHAPTKRRRQRGV
jgi:hypothetical protein